MPSSSATESRFVHWHADAAAACELCREPGGLPLIDAPCWRVVRVADAAFPAFYRVVWNTHAAEFTDLDATERGLCMDAVAVVEGALRERLRPAKINLASFGNQVPHLHWHVIARFEWDSHYPQSVWGAAQRPAEPADRVLGRLGLPLDALDDAVRAALRPLVGAAPSR